MALIKSISGIRGTIGGETNDNLTPVDIVKFAAAYGSWLLQQSSNNKIVIGRDGRISGEMVSNLVVNTLMGQGFDVIDLGLSTTPTVEMAVMFEKAAGGIIITASHNPKEWNALKLLNSKGEFISGDEGKLILKSVEKLPPAYRTVFNMYVVDECSHDEISQMLGISVGGSKSNLSRARQILKTIFEHEEFLK